jgi:hypothetical protein
MKKKRPLKPDDPNDTPRHERTEGPRERRKEYGSPKKRGR